MNNVMYVKALWRQAKKGEQWMYAFCVVAIGLMVGLSVQHVRAWTNPTVAPPGGNVAGPMNLSAIDQVKIGSIESQESVSSNDNGRGQLRIMTGAGSLPGYPSDFYPTIRTDGPYLYFSTSTRQSAYLGSHFGMYGSIYNLNPSQGWLALTGDLPGYGADIYPTLKTSGNYLYFSAGNNYSAHLSASGDLTLGGSVPGNGMLTARWFSDKDDGSYYIDPHATSRMNSISTTGHLDANYQIMNYPAINGNRGIIQYGGAYIYPGYSNTNGWNTTHYLYANSVNGLHTNGGFNVGGSLRSEGYMYANDTFYADNNHGGGGIFQGAGRYLYPGSYDRYWQNNWYIRSGPDYGLVTNTGMYFSGSVYGPAFYYTSDANLKKNVRTVPDALANVLKLHGVAFDWKESGMPSIGIIAQEVEKVYPELIQTDKKTGLKTVQYGNLIGPVIEAIKEMNMAITDAITRLTRLEGSVKEQEQKIEEQRKMIEELQKEIRSLKEDKV